MRWLEVYTWPVGLGYNVYRGCSVGDRLLFLYRFYLGRINLG